MSDQKLSDREKLIRSKQAAGLSRKQAEAVVTAQEEHDAALEENESASAKKQSAAEKKAAEKAKGEAAK